MTVLRFSNYDLDTIEVHQGIIREQGHCFWGWWKKKHEPLLSDSIQQLQIRSSPDNPLSLGLIERQAEQYYEATCEGIVWDNGNEILSPEPDCTPAYYNTRQWPLWLKFTSITEISELEWKKKFGETPKGDETFFDSTRTNGVDLIQGRIYGKRSGILHISDLHFGEDFAYQSTEAISKKKNLIEVITSSITVNPQAIVVSGDLTTRGSDDGLRSARVFIEELARKLNVPHSCVVIAPGNHDILVDNPDKKLDFANEQSYRDFVELFYNRKTGLERVHVVQGDDTCLVFGVLNSSRPRTRANMDYGYVGRDRSEPVMQEMHRQACANGNAPSYLVLHHHIQPAPLLEFLEKDRPVSITLDAGEIISFAQNYGVQAILHGHQHLPFVGSTSRIAEIGEDGPTESPKLEPGVLILGAGSAGVEVGRLGGELPENSFAFYELQSDGRINIKVFRYTPVQKPRILWDFII